MNHLHWPKNWVTPRKPFATSRSSSPAKDVSRRKAAEYFALAYVGLGDACAKNTITATRRTWRRRGGLGDGLKEYPNSPDLKKRLELLSKSPAEVIDFVVKIRGLEDPLDTDLAKVWSTERCRGP